MVNEWHKVRLKNARAELRNLRWQVADAEDYIRFLTGALKYIHQETRLDVDKYESGNVYRA